ncbi:hypothetical protein IGI37_002254 [Enterococcus sp. AZ194]|uniref:phage distal tail protein n=1 Tax=Enterococcus sp. AZ194 TaxID=2774629 RepID=UPI003F21DE70
MDFIFNNEFQLSDYKMDVLKGYQRPIFAPFSNVTKTIPGRPGAWDFGIEIGPRVDTYPIVCLAKGADERDKLINGFVGRLFDQKGQPKTFKVQTSFDSKMWIECRVSAQSTGKYYPGGNVVFDLQFSAFNDPFKRATQTAFDPIDNVKYGDVEKGDYYKNTDSFQWLYSRHYFGCHNYSSLETDIKFVLTNASGNDVSIEHLESKRELTLPNFSNARVEIDTGNKTIKINGRNILQGSNMKFFSLFPGDNGFVFKGSGVKGLVKCSWIHKFM